MLLIGWQEGPLACTKHCHSNSWQLSLIPSWGDGSLPRSSPGSSTSFSDHFGSGGWSTTPAELGHAPGSVTSDVLPFHQLHYSVDSWRSPVIQYSADRPPATCDPPGGGVPSSNTVQIVRQQRVILRHVMSHSSEVEVPIHETAICTINLYLPLIPKSLLLESAITFRNSGKMG